MDRDVQVNFVNVKAFMGQRKLTEYGLAKAMNVSYSYVYRVMRGQRPPRQSFINGLIKIGMNPNEIFLLDLLPKGNESTPDPAA